VLYPLSYGRFRPPRLPAGDAVAGVDDLPEPVVRIARIGQPADVGRRAERGDEDHEDDESGHGTKFALVEILTPAT
jgi:hypothetical protein